MSRKLVHDHNHDGIDRRGIPRMHGLGRHRRALPDDGGAPSEPTPSAKGSTLR
jgi:hypothetical protein